MSWYVAMYLGYQDKDGKIRPLGPYNYQGKLRPVIETSRSFTTDLKEDFYPISDDAWTPELEDTPLAYYNEETNTYEHNEYAGYLPLSELPTGDFIRRGYFLIDDIDAYTKNDYGFEGFYDWMTETAYHRKAENELKFGKPGPIKDCEGEEIEQHSAADYSYFSYPEYQSKEYEAFMLRNVAAILKSYNAVPEGAKIVVIKEEG